VSSINICIDTATLFAIDAPENRLFLAAREKIPTQWFTEQFMVDFIPFFPLIARTQVFEYSISVCCFYLYIDQALCYKCIISTFKLVSIVVIRNCITFEVYVNTKDPGSGQKIVF